MGLFAAHHGVTHTNPYQPITPKIKPHRRPIYPVSGHIGPGNLP